MIAAAPIVFDPLAGFLLGFVFGALSMFIAGVIVLEFWKEKP